MKPIKAFTLVELLVGLTLSAITISLAYMVYGKVKGSFRNASERFEKTNELLQLQSILNYDCNNARQVVFEDEQMKVDRVDHHSIRYMITDNSIIREEATVSDTFRLGTFKATAFFLSGKPPLMEELIIEVYAEQDTICTLSARVSYSNRFKLLTDRQNNFNN